MAAKSHKPNKLTRQAVEVLVAGGTPKRTIAKALGIAQDTLRKYYPDELEMGAEMANARVVRRLFRLIEQGSTPAAIFWLKTRAGWREGHSVELTRGPDRPAMDLEALTQKERDELRRLITKSQPRVLTG